METEKLLQFALDYHKAGDFKQAELVYKEILAGNPDYVDALHLIGVLHHQMGNLDSAIAHISKALEIDPNFAEAYNNLGNALKDKGYFDDAITYYEKAIQIEPESAAAYNNIGNVYIEKNQIEKAIVFFRKALQIVPDFAEACNNLGKALFEVGLHEEAIIYCQKAINIRPAYARAYFNLGTIFQARNQLDDAIDCFKKAIQFQNNFAEAHNNLGNALKDKGYFDDAITYYEKALQIDPDSATAYYNIGNVCAERNEMERAIAFFQKALQIMPDFAEACNNLGKALFEVGLHEEAIRYCRNAINILPDYAGAHLNLSLALLRSGNLKEGWKEYEYRLFQNKDYTPGRNQSPASAPEKSLLKNKILFIYAEQGVGDQIMFASCLPDAIDQVTLCVVECDKRLVPLFARSFPKATVIPFVSTNNSYPADLPKPDIKIALGSLPNIFRQTLSSFPQGKAYLVPDRRQADIWHSRCRKLGDGLNIGISWRGGGEPKTIRDRSITLGKWAKLFSLSKVNLINLQYGNCSGELRTVQRDMNVTIHDWDDADPLKDLDNFAAQISALDLVISIDNSTVHMAGAVGTPVWTLLPYNCDWRWMFKREDSPWYPTMKLFRQPSPGDWISVIERVSEELQRLV
jgi:tetratricopeptide (TPR) repeat protein